MKNNEIFIESDMCRLTVGVDCIVKSLVVKENGEECLQQDEEISLFSVTQERPYNNEIKLAHPNKRTTYQGNSLRREGNRLFVGFEIVPYKAIVNIIETCGYIAFELVNFIFEEKLYRDLCMTPPPVTEFRLIQLPVKNRCFFGEWLNVSWDQTSAVNVLSTSPYEVIDSERRKGYRLLTANATKSIKLRGCSAAIIASPTNKLLDAIAEVEEDYELPRGVESRRNYSVINSSVYWTGTIDPGNVDEHISYARKGGFKMMLIYYASFIRERNGYSLCGNYDYEESYPNGRQDLKGMLDKIKAAGITPGVHFLQTHIGLNSRYITPVVDQRINLTRYFTLARTVAEADMTIYVEQNPEDLVMHPKCRYLNFGGELISYEAYTTERPYCFTGCRRGEYATTISEHPAGLIGGCLDISEFEGSSAYIDQNTNLQDEIADKIAEFYNAGFQFVYFDGSEGTNIPHGFHIPNAQYRVLKKLNPQPLFAEGAAKAHFSWHFLSGGNAFDVFPALIFKESINRYPAEEAPRMLQDFTRLNFGWWEYFAPGSESGGSSGTQPDMFEYGTSRAAAWDCPVTIQMTLDALKSTPRTDDILEVMRRWEDVRQKQWLSENQKKMLRELGQEHILLINENKEYELVPYEQIACRAEEVRAFVFERKSATYVVFWHAVGRAKITLDLNGADIVLERQIGGEKVPFETVCEKVVLPVEARCYLKTAISRDEVVRAFEKAELGG